MMAGSGLCIASSIISATTQSLPVRMCLRCLEVGNTKTCTQYLGMSERGTTAYMAEEFLRLLRGPLSTPQSLSGKLDDKELEVLLQFFILQHLISPISFAWSYFLTSTLTESTNKAA